MTYYIPTQLDITADTKVNLPYIVETTLEVLDSLGRASYIYDCYYTDVSKAHFDNQLFDDLIQFICDYIMVRGIDPNADLLSPIQEAVVMMGGHYAYITDAIYNQLEPREASDADKADQVLSRTVQQIRDYRARATRGGDRYSRGYGRESAGRYNDRAQRPAYDSRRGFSDRGRGRAPSRPTASMYDAYTSKQPAQRPAYAGRWGTQQQTRPVSRPMNHSSRFGSNAGSSIADLRQATQQVQPARREPRRNPWPAEAFEPVKPEVSNQSVEQRYKQPMPWDDAVDEQEPEKLTKYGVDYYPPEILHIDVNGQVRRLLPANSKALGNRKNPYRHIPIFPIVVDGYFDLDKKTGEIIGIYSIPKDLDKEEINMDKDKHNAERFFKPWGKKNRSVDPTKTSQAISRMQGSKILSDLEREFDKKYEESEEMPNVDYDGIVISRKVVESQYAENYVATAESLYVDSFDNEELRQAVIDNGNMPSINYASVKIASWEITGKAASDSLQLLKADTFEKVVNILNSMSTQLPSSVMYEIDKMATKWTNKKLARGFGLDWTIDSFMGDIEDLVAELKNSDIEKNFDAYVSELTYSVLFPHSNRGLDASLVSKLAGIESEEQCGELKVIFADCTNITTLDIDSDEIALFMDEDTSRGIVSQASWASLTSALDIIWPHRDNFTNETVLVTRDNRTINIEKVGRSQYIMTQ